MQRYNAFHKLIRTQCAEWILFKQLYLSVAFRPLFCNASSFMHLLEHSKKLCINIENIHLEIQVLKSHLNNIVAVVLFSCCLSLSIEFYKTRISHPFTQFYHVSYNINTFTLNIRFVHNNGLALLCGLQEILKKQRNYTRTVCGLVSNQLEMAEKINYVNYILHYETRTKFKIKSLRNFYPISACSRTVASRLSRRHF